MTTRLQTYDGTCRFWEIEVKSSKTIIRHGKMGTEGKQTEQDHSSNKEAKQFAEEQIESTENRGYINNSSKRKNDLIVDERATKRIRKEIVRTPEKAAPKAKESKTVKRKTTIKPKTKTPKTKAKKAAAKKVAPKKAAAKKATPKKAAAKKATPKKAGAKKASAKKASAKKASAKKASAKKASAKKAPAKTGAKKSAAPKRAKNEKLEKLKAAKKGATPSDWEVKMNQTSFGIYVDDQFIYTGDEGGLVQQFTKDGKVQKQYRLPCGVKCIVGDGAFLYVGGNDGSLYDISHTAPRLMSKVEAFKEVYWLDIKDGVISASDESGKVALVNSEGETIWIVSIESTDCGWMCLKDDTGVYHGHSRGVIKRSLADGSEIWKFDTVSILFGQQDDKYVYACGIRCVYKLDKADGKLVHTFPAGGQSCGVTKDRKLVITADGSVFSNDDGKLIAKLAFERPDPVSMATWGEHEVYSIDEYLVKHDFSPESIKKAIEGTASGPRYIRASSISEIAPETSVAETTDTSGGVLCECVKEGGKLRVRVIAAGYDNSWNVQFPRAIREDGARYVVEKIIDQGGFYRAWGDIKKLKA